MLSYKHKKTKRFLKKVIVNSWSYLPLLSSLQHWLATVKYVSVTFYPFPWKWIKVMNRLEKLVPSAACGLARISCKISWACLDFICDLVLHISLLLIMNPRTIKVDFCSHHPHLSKRGRDGAWGDSLTLIQLFPLLVTKQWAEQQSIRALAFWIKQEDYFVCSFHITRWYYESWPKQFPPTFLLDRSSFHGSRRKCFLSTGVKNFSLWKRMHPTKIMIFSQTRCRNASWVIF